MHKLFFPVALFSVVACSVGPDESLVADTADRLASDVSVLEEYDVARLTKTRREDWPTVDVYVHMAQPAANFSWNPWPELAHSLVEVQEIFAAVGVQVHVRQAQRILVPPAWTDHDADLVDAPTGPPNPRVDFYRALELTNARLSRTNEERLRAIVGLAPDDQAIHLVKVGGGRVFMRYYGWEQGSAVEHVVRVGAFSFPSYLFADRLPSSVRGAIAVDLSDGATIAHELGHKLINVSHEGVGVCPQFEVQGDGLMLYGGGTRIPDGLAGRWQKERLLLSPYLYRLRGGERVFNPGYRDRGGYADPVYGAFIVNPVCSPP